MLRTSDVRPQAEISAGVVNDDLDSTGPTPLCEAPQRQSSRARSGAMIGESALMRQLHALIEQVAASGEPVLIQGESGTGKELVARSLHLSGPRAKHHFVAQNCTALPESLLESELFGHVKGAFTGATSMRQGLFVKAERGTLFLDEIGDMPLRLQGTFLRVIEDGEVRPVGSDCTRRVNVRIIAATNHCLQERVEKGLFRADLFYRLNVVPITTPPLRQRPEDIPALVARFILKARVDNIHTRLKCLSPELMEMMNHNAWPGNVRELENIIKRLAIVCAGETADVTDLAPGALRLLDALPPLARAKTQIIPMRQLEREYIAWVVAICNGNKTRAARKLGIDVSTIHRREKAAPQNDKYRHST